LAITRKLELLMSLRTILQSLNPIRSALSTCSSELLRLASNIFEDSFLDEISSVLELRVNEDSFLGVQKGSLAKQNVHAYAIKTGVENQLLNVA
jgi:DNA mismatch repair protein MSH4